MSRYDYERVAKIHPAGTILETDAYGVIRHVGIATGYGTVIHSSGRYGQVLETSEKLFSRGKPIRTIPHRSTLSGSALVVRARSKIGQRYGVVDAKLRTFRRLGDFRASAQRTAWPPGLGQTLKPLGRH